MSAENKQPREACCSKLKFFLCSMSFVFFAKAFCGAYMKSSITQIERRFDIPSSLIGVIDGSFEMGNLLVITFVSYFGAKLHRPRLIAIGCVVMAIGSFCIALPHFFQGPYKYETSLTHNLNNTTESIMPCLSNNISAEDEMKSVKSNMGCEKVAGSSMWVYVFLGNMLRGIGETPIMPLGVSYLDDFSKAENTPFYLACIHTIGIIGPMFGFMLGSFLAKIYVDIGFVDLDIVTITYKDSRWVGAWWLGFIVTGIVALISSIPFWFLPKSLPKEGEQESQNKKVEFATEKEQQNFLENNNHQEKEKQVSFKEMAKDFFPSLRRLFSNSVYVLIILTYLIIVNGFVGLITFKPKYIEQVFGKDPSKSVFIIGVTNLPAVALGMIIGGFLLKRLKLGYVGAARMSIGTAICSFCLLAAQSFISCDNAQVAGLTVTYQGTPKVSYNLDTLLSQCNTNCSCSVKQWDPVCSGNGITYVSPCLAGCHSSTGTGKKMVFHNCSCLGEWTVPAQNMSTVLGQCTRKGNCDHMFKILTVLSTLGSFISGLGGTAGYIVLLRSIEEDLKALALGMQTLIVRTLGGIPPPIYFGALIDRTCLKWGSKPCGGRGACRIYDANAFRLSFMGLVSGLYFTSFLLWGLLFKRIMNRANKLAARNQTKDNTPEDNGLVNGHANLNIGEDKQDSDNESTV